MKCFLKCFLFLLISGIGELIEKMLQEQGGVKTQMNCLEQGDNTSIVK